MGFLAEATSVHYRVEDLVLRFGAKAFFPYGQDVTITFLTDDIDAVCPGALYLGWGDSSSRQEDLYRQIRQAQDKGAYSILFPSVLSHLATKDELAAVASVPILFGDLNQHDLGHLAFIMAGQPTDFLATFGLTGPQATYASDYLAQLLHLLGNPIGVIDSRKSFSLERELDCSYPLGPIDTQMILSQMLEDGVNTVILTMDEETFAPGALSQVSLDVCGRTQSVDLDQIPDTAKVTRSGQMDGVRLSDESADGAASDGEESGKVGSGQGSGLKTGSDSGIGSGKPDRDKATSRSWSRWRSSSRKAIIHEAQEGLRPQLRRAVKDFGAAIDDDAHCVIPTLVSRDIASTVVETPLDHPDELYLAVAMAMSVGVRKNNVRSALLLAQEIAKRQAAGPHRPETDRKGRPPHVDRSR